MNAVSRFREHWWDIALLPLTFPLAMFTCLLWAARSGKM